MSTTFQAFDGDWQTLRVPGIREIDFHRGRRDPSIPYMQAMSEVYTETLDAIRKAHADGEPYLLIGHGFSTSGAFRVTARSMVRRALRSPEATPYIVRRDTVLHRAVARVAIRPKTAS